MYGRETPVTRALGPKRGPNSAVREPGSPSVALTHPAGGRHTVVGPRTQSGPHATAEGRPPRSSLQVRSRCGSWAQRPKTPGRHGR